MKTIFGGGAGIRWAAAVSLAGHALVGAVLGLYAIPAPQDLPPVTVELAFVDEPGSSPKIPAGPPPDTARDASSPPVRTATSAAVPGARTIRVDAREGKIRAAPAARTPRAKPPPPVRPVPRVAATVEEARPPAGPVVDRSRPAEAIPDGAASVEVSDRADAASGASPRAADVRRPAGTRTGVTRGVRVAAGNRPPGYPFAARRRGLEGQVLLRVEVNRAGAVERVTITRSSGHRLLDAAARRAAVEWRFLPATVAGEAVSGAVDVPVSFRLR